MPFRSGSGVALGHILVPTTKNMGQRTSFGISAGPILVMQSYISSSSRLVGWRAAGVSIASSHTQRMAALVTTQTSLRTRISSINRTRLFTHHEYNTSARIPDHSWDSHMHVVDPTKYPLAPNALYTPPAHKLSQAMRFESTVNLRNVVLVQPSIYGNDNTCMLDALKQIGPARGRAVVALDPSTITTQTLDQWHGMGVRGVRVNLKSVQREINKAELERELLLYANVIRPYGWVLQLFIGLEAVTWLEEIIPKLNIKVCFDHFGAPSIPEDFAKCPDPYTLPGFQSLVNLLREGTTYVKLSAPYRFSKCSKQEDIEVLAQEILRIAGKTRVVYATDWPHTRFDNVDIKPFTRKCLEWCGNDRVLVHQLFRGNAEDLWDAKPVTHERDAHVDEHRPRRNQRTF